MQNYILWAVFCILKAKSLFYWVTKYHSVFWNQICISTRGVPYFHLEGLASLCVWWSRTFIWMIGIRMSPKSIPICRIPNTFYFCGCSTGHTGYLCALPWSLVLLLIMNFNLFAFFAKISNNVLQLEIISFVLNQNGCMHCNLILLCQNK